MTPDGPGRSRQAAARVASSPSPPGCGGTFSPSSAVPEAPTTIVLGLGNPVRYDDAVGLRVAEEVERLLADQPVPGVRVLTSTRAGFELIDLLAGADHAIIVDCLEVPGGVPGTVRQLTLEDVSGASRLVGQHDLTLADAFEFARASGVSMPRTAEIYGIQAADTLRIEEGLSPEVAATVPLLARAIHERLRHNQVSSP